jgi:predicted CopG family antitoxin
MSKFKNICISESNYKLLKELGQAGDSFNDVLTKILGPKCNEELDKPFDGDSNMTQNKPIQQFRTDSIEQCLTHQCIDCSGSYINRFTGYKLKCKCSCHNKKSLEQQALGFKCSNIHHIPPCQQHGVSLDD